jgi:serine/threonine-protein kinase
VLIVAVSIAAILVAAGLFKTILNSFTSEPVVEYIVPSVVGKTIDEASEMTEVKGIFTIAEKSSEFNSEYSAGTIIRQSPDAGVQRKGDNLVISVVTSLGENTGEMIDLTNVEYQEGKIRLQALSRQYDLDLDIDDSVENQEFSDEINSGYIIRTEPAKGATLKRGDTIKIYISKGSEVKTVTVIPFTGQMIDQVQETLKIWNLKAEVEMVDDEKPAGTILSQSIEAGTDVKEGDTIKFQVSSGVVKVTMQQSYELPQDEREIVEVKVYVGDETSPQYSETVRCDLDDGILPVSLTGYGTQHIRVYYDGTLVESYDLQFN